MLRFKKVWVVSIAMFAATGINVATADAPTITGFPHQIAQVDLAGYKLVTSYPLGANAGFSFEQNYLPGGKVTAHEREQGANEWRARQIAVADGVPGASCRNAEIDTVDLDHARRGVMRSSSVMRFSFGASTRHANGVPGGSRRCPRCGGPISTHPLHARRRSFVVGRVTPSPANCTAKW